MATQWLHRVFFVRDHDASRTKAAQIFARPRHRSTFVVALSLSGQRVLSQQVCHHEWRMNEAAWKQIEESQSDRASSRMPAVILV